MSSASGPRGASRVAEPAASAMGPAAKKPKPPEMVVDKDVEGPMDTTEMSRLVRDLCRQHEFDRVGWQNMSETVTDHATKLDNLQQEHQVNQDDLTKIMEGTSTQIQAVELQMKQHLQSSMQEVEQAVTKVDDNIRLLVQEVKQEFVGLLAGLETKFAMLDRGMLEITQKIKEM